MENVYEHKLIIDKVLIENFRLFENLEFELHEKLTIFISENGAGKTTLLDAISGNLNYFTDFIKKNVINTNLPRLGKNYFPNQSDDFRDLSKPIIVNIVFNAGYFDENDERIVEDKENLVQSLLDINRNGILTYNANLKAEKDILTTDIIQQSIAITYLLNKEFSLPILVYYPCNFAKTKSDNNLAKPFNQFSIWDNALNGEAVDFSDFANWYKFLINKSNAEGKESRLQQNIKKAVLSIMNDEGYDNFTEFNLNFDSFPEELVLFKLGKNLKYNQLSSGEKQLLILVSDITRRLCIANPNTSNPLEGQGIVLIDEIDLHLHPKWQRRILPKLMETFPNIQFIVTTHSPNLLSCFDRKHLRILRDGKIVNAPFTKGRDVNSITEEVFDIEERPIEYKNKISQFYSVLNENTELARKILDDLKKDFGETDAEIIRAMSYLEIF